MISVLAEIGAGRIFEGRVDDKDEFVDGIFESHGSITINPIPATVESLIHECLHRLHPAWQERYVRNRTTYLLRRMSDDELQCVYREYQKRKKVRKVTMVTSD